MESRSICWGYAPRSWGSFNAATAVKPWRAKPLVDAAMANLQLQCGHGGEAVESEAYELGFRLGNTVLQCGHGGEAVESADGGQVVQLCVIKLQCGHGGEAVESASSCTLSRTRQQELQCGHGGEAVESFFIRLAIRVAGSASMRPRR